MYLSIRRNQFYLKLVLSSAVYEYTGSPFIRKRIIFEKNLIKFKGLPTSRVASHRKLHDGP